MNSFKKGSQTSLSVFFQKPLMNPFGFDQGKISMVRVNEGRFQPLGQMSESMRKKLSMALERNSPDQSFSFFTEEKDDDFVSILTKYFKGKTLQESDLTLSSLELRIFLEILKR